VAASAAMVAAAGALGYGVGSVINKAGFDGSDAQESLGRSLAQIAAFFGNKNAQNALNTEKPTETPEAHLHITIDSQGRATHEVVKKSHAFGLSFDAFAGHTMVTS
jgi:hypothetical protein